MSYRQKLIKLATVLDEARVGKNPSVTVSAVTAGLLAGRLYRNLSGTKKQLEKQEKRLEEEKEKYQELKNKIKKEIS